MYENETLFNIMTKLDKTIKNLINLLKVYNNDRQQQMTVTTNKTNKAVYNASMKEIGYIQSIDHNTTLSNKD